MCVRASNATCFSKALATAIPADAPSTGTVSLPATLGAIPVILSLTMAAGSLVCDPALIRGAFSGVNASDALAFAFNSAPPAFLQQILNIARFDVATVSTTGARFCRDGCRAACIASAHARSSHPHLQPSANHTA